MASRVIPLLISTFLAGGWLGATAGQDAKKGAGPDKDLAPKLVTIQEKEISLAEALKALEKQTGIKVQDARRDKDKDKLKLNLEKVTFWQALEAIAREADLRLYEPKLALVNHEAGYREFPTSYDGLFRTVVKRVVATRDLETDEPVYVAHLLVTWEPRFQGFFVETRPDSLIAKDTKGRTLKAPDGEKEPVPVNSNGTVAVEMRIPVVPRSSTQISQLKGELAVVGSSKTLTFSFDGLDKFVRNKPVDKTQEGVTVKLFEFSPEKEIWTIGFRLEYPPGGPKIESFQSWVTNNKVYLEDKDGKRFEANGGYELDQMGTTAVVRYRFIEERNLPLGKPANWKLIYVTPGQFTETAIRFDFKDVPLP